ncbi:hypothetical protein CVT24_010716, partial [Panaeolus cyanescens]
GCRSGTRGLPVLFPSNRKTLPPNWPGAEIIDAIVEKSSGQFIFTATVMKYIGSGLHLPDARLKMVMGDSSNQNDSNHPFAGIDTLYKHIISTSAARDVALHLIAFDRVHSAYGEIISVDWLEDGLRLERGVVYHSLEYFQSLLAILDPPTQLIKFYHASFTDFLCDKDRAGEWYIDIGQEAENFVIIDLEAFIDSNSWEESRFWFIHFCKAMSQANPTERLTQMLEETWLDISSFVPGYKFLQDSGSNAYVLVHFINMRNGTDTARGTSEAFSRQK